MKDWREKLERTEKPVAAKLNDPNLCNCMAAMKGKWIDGVYTCVRCEKPVYDSFGRR
ncbi:hypothetical protein J27TS7_11190 [Paenibacillus dendritiformis]|nr:hypothetical protein J27TS7_11190 [Paenibacillus dendritiformis]